MTTAIAQKDMQQPANASGCTHTFQQYADSGFGRDLLPIIPTHARLHPDSAHLAPNRGKVPGQKRSQGWVGLRKWTDHSACPADLVRWDSWESSIGIHGRCFPAIDIDVEDQSLADAIDQLAAYHLGDAPVRFGRQPRRIRVYAGTGIRKRRMVFGLPGASKDERHAIEILGAKQQYVLEGVHPKTLKPYSWLDGVSPVEWGSGALTVIDDAKLDVFMAAVGRMLAERGLEVTTRSTGRPRASDDQSQSALMAPNIGAVERALAALPNEFDYDDWIKVMAATKAATGGSEEGAAAFAAWSATSPLDDAATTKFKYNSFGPTYSIGWDWLAATATDKGDGTFSAAAEEFDEVPAEQSGGLSVSGLFRKYVWVERLKKVCDIDTGELLDREQINVRHSNLGDPTKMSDCAWAILISDRRKLRQVKGLTYRPGAGLFVEETAGGLAGLCINRWRDPNVDLPVSATNDDIRPWLEHAAFVIPDDKERGIALDWLAWVAQHPGEKPNWCLVIGSTAEGIGKDLMLLPMRKAIGPENVREIGPDDLASNNTDYLENTRLLIIEEMEMAERKAMMNKLKPLVASPPNTLRVNIKFLPQFEIPNIVAPIFLTNMNDALALSRGGRRYFVTWNEGSPRPPKHYADLVDWYDAGGDGLVARWLLQRDVSGFDAKGRAPETAAKESMRLAARSRRDEIAEEALADREGPFAHRLFTVGEVFEYVTERFDDRHLTEERLSALLKKAGCVTVGRLALGEAPPGHVDHRRRAKKMNTLLCRRSELLSDPTLDEMRAVYWADRRPNAV